MINLADLQHFNFVKELADKKSKRVRIIFCINFGSSQLMNYKSCRTNSRGRELNQSVPSNTLDRPSSHRLIAYSESF